MNDVRTNIGSDLHLARDDDIERIRGRLTSAGVCLLVGESGSGKSALAKEISTRDYPRAIWLTERTLDHASLPEFEQSMGLSHPLIEVLQHAPERCLIVFDALESCSEAALRTASKLLKQVLALGHLHLHVLGTVQFESAARKLRELSVLGVPQSAFPTVPVGRPSEAEIQSLLANKPRMVWMSLRPELRTVLTNLKILDWVSSTVGSVPLDRDAQYLGHTALIDLLWQHWAESTDQGYARSYVLMHVATLEAEFFVSRRAQK